jgi:phosphoadenosine phosphosulfate reductase
MTSSFQTQSVPLLHIISNHFRWIKVIFIDTGYLFVETYQFKQQLEKEFNLEIITISSNKDYLNQRTNSGLMLYSQDTDRCCYINKVEPIDDLLNLGDAWISGVRRDQTSVRKKLNPIEIDSNGIIRIHPMLEWNSKDIYDYIKNNNLPKHPLEKEGYMSIGCVPCTNKISAESGRDGRWVGQQKTECGLHLKNTN